MGKVISILEDNEDRVSAMQKCLGLLEPGISWEFFNSATKMIEWFGDEPDVPLLISLDHDLELLNGPDGQMIDPGDGRDVARYLAGRVTRCPVIIHTSNSAAASSMMLILQDAGWEVIRVFPMDGPTWISLQWFDSVRRLLS